MAQRRMLSKKISVSIQVKQLSIKARLLFTWMIAHADDVGLLPHNVTVLKAVVLPMAEEYNETDINKCLDEIINAKLIDIFEYEGQKFYRFKKFFSHQTLKKDRYPQTILEIVHDKDPQKIWNKIIKLVHGENNEFQLETQEFQLSPEVKLSEVKIRASHPQKNPKEKPDKKPNKKKEVSEVDKRLHKDVVELIDYFEKKYESSMGKKPIITSFVRYIKQSKPFVKKLGVNRMKMLCDAYFITFDDKFIKQNAWSIGIFLTDNIINSLNNKYS